MPPVIAETASIWNTVNQLSSEFWVRIGLAVLVIIVVVITLRKLARMNRLILFIVAAVVASIVGFNWIYERNEPRWATPLVDVLAGFFPSKGKVEQKKSGL